MSADGWYVSSTDAGTSHWIVESTGGTARGICGAEISPAGFGALVRHCPDCEAALARRAEAGTAEAPSRVEAAIPQAAPGIAGVLGRLVGRGSG